VKRKVALGNSLGFQAQSDDLHLKGYTKRKNLKTNLTALQGSTPHPRFKLSCQSPTLAKIQEMKSISKPQLLEEVYII